MTGNIDSEIFSLASRIKTLMTRLEEAEALSDNHVEWRRVSAELNATTRVLAQLAPESLPAAAAVCDAAVATGAPELIYAVRDYLLRQAAEQAEAAEHFRARIEDEPPIGMLPDGSLNVIEFKR